MIDVPEYDRVYRNTEGCIREQMYWRTDGSTVAWI